VRDGGVREIEAPGTLRGGCVGIESRQVPIPVTREEISQCKMKKVWELRRALF
jgi:hypothetical protein